MAVIDFSTTTLAAGAALLLLAIFALRPRRTFSAPLPPSPKRLPLIGHTHLLSGCKYSWVTFLDIFRSLPKQEQNAGVMYMRLGTSDVLVISTCKAAQDLLEKKSAIYSDRPRMIVVNEYISNNRRMVLQPYNDTWRALRRFLHGQLHDKFAATYEPVQDQEAKALAFSILEDPDEYANHLQLFSSNVILQVAYNRRARNAQDEVIQGMIHSIETWSLSALPGAHLVADFPILDYVPTFLSPWKKNAIALHQFELELYDKLTAGVRRKMKAGQLPECLMRHLLENQAQYGFDDELVNYAAGTLFEAGSDTTTSLLTSLFLACTAIDDPKGGFWKRAQEEVDRVVGENRMPSFEDAEDLPYIVAIGKELQRWRPAVPSAVPHALTQDDEYMGYHLPAKSTVICNTWAIGRDPNVFPDGEAFRPERYLGKEGEKVAKALNKGHTGFGHARRICPGLHVAERSLFIAIASLAWSFDITASPSGPKPDVNNFTTGFVSRSERFRVQVTPRCEKRRAMVRSEGKEVMRTWEAEGVYED